MNDTCPIRDGYCGITVRAKSLELAEKFTWKAVDDSTKAIIGYRMAHAAVERTTHSF